jgi:peptide/nickel transport system substrate-binding protein
MHRRVWFLVAAVAAVLGLAGSAAAMTAAGSSSSSRALAATPFSKALANVPRTPQARAASKVVKFAMEQDAGGWNLANQDFTGAWAAYFGETPIIRGNYIIDQKGNYHLDMAKKVVVTRHYLRIFIKKNANWWWQGHGLHPVTAQDYIYTWKAIVTKGNNVASTTGYDEITRAKAKGKKEVTFYWKKPFADYRDIFGYIYPSYALKGITFNQLWAHCVCGNDNKPISDGPFYLSHWTPGQGVILKANPHWYGKKPALKEIVGQLFNDENSEVQAMKGGEVDAIFPGQPTNALSALLSQKNLNTIVTPGYVQEHIDVEFGPAKSAAGGTHTAEGAALLSKQYFRAAISEGLNRQPVINAVYNGIVPKNKLKPLNNPEWEFGSLATGKHAYFSPYNYNPKKAIATLKSHGCSGGPSKPSSNNSKIWTCAGHKAEIGFYTTTAPARELSAQVFQQQLLEIGIKLDVKYFTAQPDFFTNLLPTGAFDLAEYAWSGGPDPSGFDAIYQCVNSAKGLGGQNYKNYCSAKVDKLLRKGDSELNATKRIADYEAAAKILSQQISIIPLYARPVILIYKKAIKGMSKSDNPTSEGPTWNAQDWKWGS